MKKVILIDDEPLARSVAIDYLQKHPDLTVVAECGNGFEGVKAIQQHQPDLVILDIQMPKISGFEMLELLEEMPPVIFATAFDEFAIQAFEKNAVDYLLKPFSEERFDLAIGKWRQRGGRAAQSQEKMLEEPRTGEERNRVVVRSNSEIFIVPTAEIHYIEAYDDYVKIFTGNDYFLKKKTMGHYETVLDPQSFFRAHRSYIVNLAQVARIEPLEKNSYLILLKSGKRIPLSRNAYGKLKVLLGI